MTMVNETATPTASSNPLNHLCLSFSTVEFSHTITSLRRRISLFSTTAIFALCSKAPGKTPLLSYLQSPLEPCDKTPVTSKVPGTVVKSQSLGTRTQVSTTWHLRALSPQPRFPYQASETTCLPQLPPTLPLSFQGSLSRCYLVSHALFNAEGSGALVSASTFYSLILR